MMLIRSDTPSQGAAKVQVGCKEAWISTKFTTEVEEHQLMDLAWHASANVMQYVTDTSIYEVIIY